VLKSAKTMIWRCRNTWFRRIRRPRN